MVWGILCFKGFPFWKGNLFLAISKKWVFIQNLKLILKLLLPSSGLNLQQLQLFILNLRKKDQNSLFLFLYLFRTEAVVLRCSISPLTWAKISQIIMWIWLSISYLIFWIIRNLIGLVKGYHTPFGVVVKERAWKRTTWGLDSHNNSCYAWKQDGYWNDDRVVCIKYKNLIHE